jgi:hypothetical protein
VLGGRYSDQGGAGWTLGAPFAPAYAFGSGLDYLNVSVVGSTAALDEAARCVNFTISLYNAAPRAGSHVVQVYFNQQLSRFTCYKLMLAGFEKVPVPANDAATAAISVPYADLAYYYPRERTMVLESGDLNFFVCRDSGSDGCLLASQDQPVNATHVVTVPATVMGL